MNISNLKNIIPLGVLKDGIYPNTNSSAIGVNDEFSKDEDLNLNTAIFLYYRKSDNPNINGHLFLYKSDENIEIDLTNLTAYDATALFKLSDKQNIDELNIKFFESKCINSSKYEYDVFWVKPTQGFIHILIPANRCVTTIIINSIESNNLFSFKGVKEYNGKYYYLYSSNFINKFEYDKDSTNTLKIEVFVRDVNVEDLNLLNSINNILFAKQDVIDYTLETNANTIPEAINELFYNIENLKSNVSSNSIKRIEIVKEIPEDYESNVMYVKIPYSEEDYRNIIIKSVQEDVDITLINSEGETVTSKNQASIKALYGSIVKCIVSKEGYDTKTLYIEVLSESDLTMDISLLVTENNNSIIGLRLVDSDNPDYNIVANISIYELDDDGNPSLDENNFSGFSGLVNSTMIFDLKKNVKYRIQIVPENSQYEPMVEDKIFTETTTELVYNFTKTNVKYVNIILQGPESTLSGVVKSYKTGDIVAYITPTNSKLYNDKIKYGDKITVEVEGYTCEKEYQQIIFDSTPTNYILNMIPITDNQ